MATFEAQVEGLTSLAIDGSSAPTQTELTQFLTDGAKDIINQMPSGLIDLCAAQQTFTSVVPGSEAETINTGKILNVFRNDGDIDQPCRKISNKNKGRAIDSDDMSYASITDPVYYVENNKINSLPAGGSCKYSEVQYPTVAYGDSAISVFPDEAEYLVPLYASVKALQNVLGNKSSNSDITTALTAAKTELNETQDVCDKIDADLVLAKAEVVLAKTEADEITTQTDNSGNFETACDAMATELNKVDEIITLANEEFDEVATQTSGSKDSPITDAFTQFELVAAQLALGETDSEGDVNTAMSLLKTAVDQAASAADKFEVANTASVFGDTATFDATNSQLTRVKGAVDNAESVINGNQPSASSDAFGAQSNEDVELVSSVLNIAQTEIRRAQAHIQEWVAIGDMRVKEINSALSEADGYVKEIQTRLQQASAKREQAKSRISAGSAYLQEAQGIIQAGNAYLQEAQARIGQAQGYAAEVNARGAFTSAKSKAVQGHISTAQSYVATARGFGDEIQAKVQIAQGYGNEVQLRLSVDSAQYGWLEKQQAKLQADYDKGLQALR